MPTTTNGLPYPAPTDAPNIPLHIQQLAEAVDPLAKSTAWVVLRASDPKVSLRQEGKTCHLIVDGNFAAPSAAFTTVATAIVPSGQRPPSNPGTIRGAAILNGYAAAVMVNTGGDLIVANFTGAARTTISGTVIWLL